MTPAAPGMTRRPTCSKPSASGSSGPHGRPFTRRQLERLVREAGLEPTAWSQTLYVPPWGPLLPLADGFEQVGRRVMPGAAGVILLEATRQAYARVHPGTATAPATVLAPALQPQPASRSRRVRT